MGIQYPLINGNRHSFSSIEAKIAGQKFTGFKSINYSRERDRAYVWGTNADPIGKTRGKNTPSGDCELYLAEFEVFCKILGGGFGDKPFNVKVAYRESGFVVIQDVLLGCTLDSTEASNGDSTDASVRKFKLNPLKILWNGRDDNARRLGGVGQSIGGVVSDIASAIGF
jgi:hypothetical protein